MDYLGEGIMTDDQLNAEYEAALQWLAKYTLIKRTNLHEALHQLHSDVSKSDVVAYVKSVQEACE